MTTTPAFSPSSLQLFAELLGTSSVNMADPAFDQKTAIISLARKELIEALKAAGVGGDETAKVAAVTNLPNRQTRRASAKKKPAQASG